MSRRTAQNASQTGISTKTRQRAIKPPSRYASVPSEHDEQVALFEWAELAGAQHPCLRLMFAIPNGGHRHIAVARRLKAEGVKAGVPDIFLPWPNHYGWHGMFIEMKRRKGGVLSDEQRSIHEALGDAEFYVTTCKGWEAARDAILEYLGGAE